MRLLRLLSATILSVLIAGTAVAAPTAPFGGGTGMSNPYSGALPAAAGKGRIALRKDAASETDCTGAGGSSTYACCYETLSTWEPCGNGIGFVLGDGLNESPAGTINTYSVDAGFVEDGAGTALTCTGVQGKGSMQVMVDGQLQYCDGWSTPKKKNVVVAEGVIGGQTVYGSDVSNGATLEFYSVPAGGPTLGKILIGRRAGGGGISVDEADFHVGFGITDPAYPFDMDLGIASFNDQVRFEKADGTAPMIVTSTTKVANLNVDRIDDLDSTAFVAVTGDIMTGPLDVQLSETAVSWAVRATEGSREVGLLHHGDSLAPLNNLSFYSVQFDSDDRVLESYIAGDTQSNYPRFHIAANGDLIWSINGPTTLLALGFDGTNTLQLGSGDHFKLQGAGEFTAGTTGSINASTKGVKFTHGDANQPTCAGAGDFAIWADDSEGKLKKCQDGTTTDLDTGFYIWGAGLEESPSGTAKTASQEAAFVADGVSTALTCTGVQGKGSMQVMVDGQLQYCDGWSTPKKKNVVVAEGVIGGQTVYGSDVSNGATLEFYSVPAGGPTLGKILIGRRAGGGGISVDEAQFRVGFGITTPAYPFDMDLGVASFNDQVRFEKADGTTPMIVTSTTKVANLNVDRIDDLDSTAFVATTGDSMTGPLDIDTTGATPTFGFHHGEAGTNREIGTFYRGSGQSPNGSLSFYSIQDVGTDRFLESYIDTDTMTNAPRFWVTAEGRHYWSDNSDGSADISLRWDATNRSLTSTNAIGFDIDTSPAGCDAGEYRIYANSSTLKKCVNGTITDLDTTATGAYVLKSGDSMSGTLLLAPTVAPDDALSVNNFGQGGVDELMIHSDAGKVQLELNPNNSGDIPFLVQIHLEAYPRFSIDAAGIHRWSSGSGVVDTELYRSGGSTISLGVGDSLVAPGNLTAQNQLISSVAYPTPPLVVTSNALVSNLNAQYISGQGIGNFAILPGQAGGQTLNGGTAASENLTLSSTASVTKGKILFGTSAYDQVNNRLGIGKTAPTVPLDVVGAITATGTVTAPTFSGNATTATTATKATNLVGGNPTTLLGAMPYQSNTDTTTLLSPNTANYAKFLRLRGTGTNGAAPEWVTSASYQFIDAENTSIEFNTLCDTNNWAGAISIDKGGFVMRYCSDEANPTVRYVALGDAGGWAENAVYASGAGSASTATTATNATNVNVLSAGTDSTMWVLLGGSAATGNQQARGEAALNYAADTNTLYSDNFWVNSGGSLTIAGNANILFTGTGSISMAGGSITGIGNGSTTTPSISFTGDSNTGLYHSTGDSGIVGFTSQGGTQTFALNTSYAESSATFRGPAMMFTTSGVNRFLLDQSLSAGQPTRDGMALTNYCDHYNGSCNSMEIYTDSISATPPAAYMGADIDWYMDDSGFSKSYMGTLRYRWDVATAGSERSDFQIYAIGTDLGTYPYFEIDGGSDTTILATPYEATTSGYPVPVVARIRSQAYDKDLNPTNRPGDVGEGGQLVFMANNSGSNGTDMVALEFSWDDETTGTTDGSFHIKLKDDNNWAPFLHMEADYDREASSLDYSRIYPAKPGMASVASKWVYYTHPNATDLYLLPAPTGPYVVTKCGSTNQTAWDSTVYARIDVGNDANPDGFMYQSNLKTAVDANVYAIGDQNEAELGKYQTDTNLHVTKSTSGTTTQGKTLVWCEYILVDPDGTP